LEIDPGFNQYQGEWNKEEHLAFMRRYQQFLNNNWRIGSCWGCMLTFFGGGDFISFVVISHLEFKPNSVFSCGEGLEHRVGYQCSAYYRKLVQRGMIQDLSYGWDDKGVFRRIHAFDDNTLPLPEVTHLLHYSLLHMD
jgi:hypothetical protein